MNLIGRVLIMVVCVFTAYAMPNLGNVGLAEENSILKAVIARLGNHLPIAVNNSTNNSTNNTQDDCFAVYSNQLNQINARTVNETQACYEYANSALAFYNIHANQTLAEVNAQASDLQARLANCSRLNSSDATFNCYVDTFDPNLGDLYNITIQSQVAVSAWSGFELEVQINRQSCVSRVLIRNKSSSTAAANNLQVCLNNSTGGSYNPGNSTQPGNSTNPGNNTNPGNSTNPGNRTMIFYIN